ncbi:MAG: SgcJ/EcaC family oxidoreductase, partial [Pseudomonadota bacterium]
MQKRSPSILVLLVSLGACQSYPDALSDADVSAIQAASDEWVATYNANDWDALAKLFSPDATMMPPNSPQVIGRDSISAWEAEYETGFQIAFDVQDIEGDGNFAYVRGRSCVFIPLETGGYGVDVGKYLEVRKKDENGNWLIVSDIFNSDAA